MTAETDPRYHPWHHYPPCEFCIRMNGEPVRPADIPAVVDPAEFAMYPIADDSLQFVHLECGRTVPITAGSAVAPYATLADILTAVIEHECLEGS